MKTKGSKYLGFSLILALLVVVGLTSIIILADEPSGASHKDDSSSKASDGNANDGETGSGSTHAEPAEVALGSCSEGYTCVTDESECVSKPNDPKSGGSNYQGKSHACLAGLIIKDIDGDGYYDGASLLAGTCCKVCSGHCRDPILYPYSGGCAPGETIKSTCRGSGKLCCV